MRNGDQFQRFAEDTFTPSIFSAKDCNLLIDFANAMLHSEVRIGPTPRVLISDRNFIWQIPSTLPPAGSSVPTDEDAEDSEIGAGMDDLVTVIRKFPDGHLYVAGQFKLGNAFSRTCLCSMRQNLSLRSPSWFIGTQVDGLISGNPSVVRIFDIAQRSGNKFYAAGNFLQFAAGGDHETYDQTLTVNLQVPTANVVKLGLDGTIRIAGLDTPFTPPAIQTRDDLASTNLKDARIYAVQTANYMTAADAVLCAGNFDAVGGTETHGLVVLKEDGTVYVGFDAGTGFQQIDAESVTDSIINYGCDWLLPAAPGADGWYASCHIFGGALGSQVGVGVGPACDPMVGTDSNVFYDGTPIYGGICRIAGDGSLDTSFAPGSPNPNGCTALQEPNLGLTIGVFSDSGSFRALCVNADGDVYIANPTAHWDPTTSNAGGWVDTDGTTILRQILIKLHADGSLDTTFDATVVGYIQGGAVRSAAIDSQNRLVIGGTFALIDGNTYEGFARLDADTGELDTTFPNISVAGGPGATVDTIIVETGDVYCIGGNFVQLTDPIDGNVVRNYIARVSSTGRIL